MSFRTRNSHKVTARGHNLATAIDIHNMHDRKANPSPSAYHNCPSCGLGQFKNQASSSLRGHGCVLVARWGDWLPLMTADYPKLSQNWSQSVTFFSIFLKAPWTDTLALALSHARAHTKTSKLWAFEGLNLDPGIVGFRLKSRLLEWNPEKNSMRLKEFIWGLSPKYEQNWPRRLGRVGGGGATVFHHIFQSLL